MPYDQPYSQAPQPSQMGSPQDWTPADLHPDPTANQQLNHLAQLGVDPESFAALIKSITARATAPDPSMPQAPQEKSLGIWESIAAALHPELLQQFKRDPSANPQFQSQMAAFQQAMIGKRQATSDLLGLAGRDLTGQYGLAGKEATASATTQAAQTRATAAAQPKPASPTAAKPPMVKWDENGNQIQWDAASGRWIPSLNEKGEQVKKTPAANLQGIQQQLDNADRLMSEMLSNYQAGPKSTMLRSGGTAAANVLGGTVGGSLGLSGLASTIDPHAVVHERDREALATVLTFPLTGSRRSVEGARQSLLKIIPHYSDPPNVWAVFERQMRDVINSARRMPWGSDPQMADQYGVQLDAAIARMQSESGGGAPPVKSRAQQILDDIKAGK